jgi:hypothetical protein
MTLDERKPSHFTDAAEEDRKPAIAGGLLS